MEGSTRGRRSLTATALRSSAANVALPLSSVLTGPILARVLEPAGRGTMAALLAPISLANLIFTLGLPDALAYHVARGRLDRPGARRGIATAAVLGGGVSVVLLVVAAPLLLRRYPAYLTAFALLALSLPVTLGFAALRGVAQGQRQFDRISLERVAGALVRLLAIAGLALAGLLTPLNAAWVSVVAGAAGSLLLLPALRVPAPREPSPARSAEVLRFARRAALGTLGSFLVVRLDQMLMAPLAGAAQLGYYAVAVSLAELPIALVAAVRDIVFTVATDTRDPSAAARAARFTILVMVPVCAAGAAAAPLVIPLLFGQGFAPAVPMVQVLFAGTVALSVTAILGAGLLSLGRAAQQSAVQLGGAAATAVLLLLLVPRLQGMGGAISSAIAYTTVAVAMTVVFARATGLPVRACVVPTRADASAAIARLRGVRGRRA